MNLRRFMSHLPATGCAISIEIYHDARIVLRPCLLRPICRKRRAHPTTRAVKHAKLAEPAPMGGTTRKRDLLVWQTMLAGRDRAATFITLEYG